MVMAIVEAKGQLSSVAVVVVQLKAGADHFFLPSDVAVLLGEQDLELGLEWLVLSAEQTLELLDWRRECDKPESALLLLATVWALAGLSERCLHEKGQVMGAVGEVTASIGCCGMWWCGYVALLASSPKPLQRLKKRAKVK